MIEGIFGFLMAFSYTFINGQPLKEYNEINTFKNKNGKIKLFYLTALLLLE